MSFFKVNQTRIWILSSSTTNFIAQSFKHFSYTKYKNILEGETLCVDSKRELNTCTNGLFVGSRRSRRSRKRSDMQAFFVAEIFLNVLKRPAFGLGNPNQGVQNGDKTESGVEPISARVVHHFRQVRESLDDNEHL